MGGPLWLHNVVVCPLIRPGECTTTPDPSGEYDERGEVNPKSGMGPFTEIPLPAAAKSRCTTKTTAMLRRDHEPAGLTVNDGGPTWLTATACSSMPKTTRSVGKSDTSNPMARPVD